MATTTDRQAEAPIVKNATEARQGATGHNVRYVLGTAITLVVVLFAGLWLFYFH